MGGTLQKILQRGDGQKGYGIRAKRALLPSLLFIAYAGLILDLPSKKPVFWFSFSLLPVTVYLFLYFIRRQRRYIFETFSSFALIIAGGIQLLKYGWLHIAYMPYLILLSLFYRPGVMIPISLTVPLLEIPHFMRGNLIEEAFFSIAMILSSVLVSTVVSKVKEERDRARRSFDSLMEEAEDIAVSATFDITGGEGFLSQHLSSTNTANEEIREVLLIAKHIMSADSAHVFILKKNSLHLRCSAEGSRSERIIDEESLRACIQRRQSVVFDTRDNIVSSHIATPIMDGNYVSGVLVVHGGRSKAFKDSDVEIAEMFSSQIMRILQRQRIYSQLQKEHLMLKKLKDGGSRLTTSLKIEDIARSLIEAVYSIAPRERVSIALFLPRGERFEVIRQIGFTFPEGSTFDLRNSRIGLVSRSREPDYISDLRNERTPVLPFKINDEGSVFMLPLSYEKELLGVLVFLSTEVNAIHPYQIELLKVLGNQASSSLANAQFHSEIERMAITDGLTGLFNHRNFHEKLADEFRRLERFSEPLSLLLIDIDFFKKVNDTHGHPAGDEVLRSVAAIIKETIRNIDIPARYGGEEFAALLLGTNHEGALRMAERLRESITEKIFSIDGKDLRLTVSIGAATSPYDTGNKEELIEKADQALYYAKRNGRNRCVLWSEIK